MDSVEEVTEIITEENNSDDEEIDDTKYDGVEMIPLHLIKVAKGQNNGEYSRGKCTKYYKQTYRPAWELSPDFKDKSVFPGWLKAVEGEPNRAYCIYCEKTLHAHRLSLLKHTCTIRHQKAAQYYTRRISNEGRKDATTSRVKDNDMEIIITEDSIIPDDSGEFSQIIYTQEEIEDGSNEQEDETEFNDGELEETEELISENTQIDKEQISNTNSKMSISTYVVDVTKGTPVNGLSVSLYKLIDGRWTYMNEGLTDSYGSYADLINATQFSPGRYKLHYDVDRYFDSKKQDSLFPFIETVFDASHPTKYHFPLLLSANSYTTYRSLNDG